MDKYEIMFIVKATNESEQVAAVANNFKNLVTELGSKVLEFKELGQKKLAYPIKKEINGYYYVMQIEANHETVKEFDRKALLDENLLRHLIIKLDEE